MAKFPALPLWTDALIADTDHLTDAEFGLYMRLLIMIWRSPNCRIPADDKWIARRTKRSVQDFENTVKPLMQEYMHTDGNHIMQKRLQKEYHWVMNKRQKNIDAAKSRWEKEKDLCERNAPIPTPTPTPIKKEVSKEVSKISAKKPVAIPIPPDWRPNARHYGFASKLGLSIDDVDDEAETVRLWSSGNGEWRPNWDAFFMNWLKRRKHNGRQVSGFNGHGNGGNARQLQDPALSVSRAAGRLAEAAERGEFKFGPTPSLFPEKSASHLRLLPKR